MKENLVVIPTYNERENIEKLIDGILSLPVKFDILVIDDSSPDRTWKIVQEKVQEEERVNLIIRPQKQGLGRAYQEGFLWGLEEGYKFFFQMDADFSHSPEDLLRIKEESKKFPVVIGSRYVKGGKISGWSKKREILSRMGNLYIRFFLNLPVEDATSGFRFYHKKVLEKVPLRKLSAKGFSFQIEMTFWVNRLGFLIKELPITFRERTKGKSKMDLSIIKEALFLVPRLRRKECRKL